MLSASDKKWMFQTFATKDDVRKSAHDNLRTFATKDDLRALATKDDLRALATKDELNDLRREMRGMHVELKEMITAVLLHIDASGRYVDERFDDVEARVTRLEHDR